LTTTAVNIRDGVDIATAVFERAAEDGDRSP
jgi:hypothetical protein